MLLPDRDTLLRLEIHPLEHLGLVLLFVADRSCRRPEDDQADSVDQQQVGSAQGVFAVAVGDRDAAAGQVLVVYRAEHGMLGLGIAEQTCYRCR